MRGPQYSWANSRRLQALLADAGIGYRHHRELAPTTELRHLQYREDDRTGWASARESCWHPNTSGATSPRSSIGLRCESLVDELPAHGVGALFCVECAAAACHRSLIAERLAERYGLTVDHLMPEPDRA